MKAAAIAHPMQALVKYHGLRDWKLRIPYHDSISVNMEALVTKTTVEFGDFEEDEVFLNSAKAEPRSFKRVMAVVEEARRISGETRRVRIISQNSLDYSEAKGLGFSSSGGAALAAALFKAADLNWDLGRISRTARLFSGSACRSVVGGYALWHAGVDHESSYAEKIADKEDLDLGIVIVPIASEVKTEEAHREVESSPFFNARIKSAGKRVVEMREAIRQGDLKRVAELAEIDSLELHALTMTGRKGLLAYKPESILVMSEIRRMRQHGLNTYFSMQTGPSVYINTYPEEVREIKGWIRDLGLKAIESRVGGEVRVAQHFYNC